MHAQLHAPKLFSYRQTVEMFLCQAFDIKTSQCSALNGRFFTAGNKIMSLNLRNIPLLMVNIVKDIKCSNKRQNIVFFVYYI